MTPEIKQLISKALDNYRGDNLARARIAFRGLSPEQMSKEYGQSGKSMQQILNEYELHAAQVDTAINIVKNL